MPDNRSMMPPFACMVAADHLGTTVRPRATLFIDQITEYISLRSAFEKLKQIAGRTKPLNALFLVAHVQFEWVQVGAYNRKSPIGIGLGHEGLFASNVSLWKAIQGRTKNIIVYSCLAARTQPDSG